jgi:hypothetical protein
MSAGTNLFKRPAAVGAIALALCASQTPAAASYRTCTASELRGWSSEVRKCKASGRTVQCKETTGQAMCCVTTPLGATFCDYLASVQITVPPPGPKPPSVKVDILTPDSFGQQSIVPRTHGVDAAPSSAGSVKSPSRSSK